MSETIYLHRGCPVCGQTATDPAWRQEICSRIREASPVLFENYAFIRELEDTLEKMVRQPTLLPSPMLAAQAQEMQAGA